MEVMPLCAGTRGLCSAGIVVKAVRVVASSCECEIMVSGCRTGLLK
jgi:hypothetical protein